MDAVLCNGILKNLFGRIRPCDVNTSIQLLIARPDDYSFPSGHTAVSFAAVAALVMTGEQKLWKHGGRERINLRGQNIMKIRVATAEDAKSIQSIYAPYIEKTAITFEYDIPSIDDFRQRIINTLKEYPYLVAVDQERIVGYAYASSFHSRAAYKHSAEVSIYLHEKWHKKGIGKQLYQELENRLMKQNVFVLYACITTTDRNDDENLTDASICFHKRMGYATVGKHNLCGYKFNKWYSVIWMEKVITNRADKPNAFIPFSELSTQAITHNL